jgi:hypothetical protein
MSKLYCSEWGEIKAETLFSTELGRVVLDLTDIDKGKFDRLPAGPSAQTVTVTDQHSGVEFLVRRTDCGAGCFCAAYCEQVEPEPAEN